MAMRAARRPRRPLRSALVPLLVVLLAACTSGPEPVHIGSDECAQCRMTISDPAFAAQTQSTRGLAFKFDAIECLAAFLDEGTLPADEVRASWVMDHGAPDTWLPVDSAVFVQSAAQRSPMGAGLSAHGSLHAAEARIAALGEGVVLDWAGAREHARGVGHGHGHGSGHGQGHGRVGVRGGRAADHARAADIRDGDLVVGAGERLTSVRAAVAEAAPGARIVVLPGVYREGVITVDRRVELVGIGYPVLDGEDRSEVLVVTADSVVVRGFEIRGAGMSYVADNAALRFEGVTGCVAAGNRLRDNFFGIYVARSRDCRISDNDIAASGTREAATGNGIHLWNSTGTQLVGNRIRGHRDGIYLEYANETRISGNSSEQNLRYGLHFMFSHDTEYRTNTFRRNGAGVAVMYSRRVLMAGNTFDENWGPTAYGLLLKEISESEISGNVFLSNTIGIYSEGSSRLELVRNRFVRNGWAVRVMSNSRDNRFADNDFIDNTFDVSTDSRQNFNTFERNYWSRYDGYDLVGDGFGDVPHRPVRLFSLIVQRNPATLVLLRSLFVDVLDRAERVMPVLTPETLVDNQPRMKEIGA